jgi:hypothetical protein
MWGKPLLQLGSRSNRAGQGTTEGTAARGAPAGPWPMIWPAGLARRWTASLRGRGDGPNKPKQGGRPLRRRLSCLNVRV